ncbi:MAG: hypothetical protein ACJAT5_000363 [Lentimonas sp.]
MKRNTQNIFALPQPDGNGYQISYEVDNSRKVHRLGDTPSSFEKPPHGAGSFHDPEQHQIFMERIEDYINNTRS